MRRVVVVLALVGLALVTLVPGAWAQEGHFVLEELHLISWQSLPEGHPSHTSAVSSAVLMAWHAEHGYPHLLPDLTGDGRRDGDDTVLLAQQFAEAMAPDHRNGVYDPHVMDVLATYVAERYPDEFLLLIFDPSFADEYDTWMGRDYDADGYPGIEILLLGEPEYETFANLLEEYRPGVVGYGYEPEPNRFSVSRSREQAEGDSGGPVGLVNTDRGFLGPEWVWDTELRCGGEQWWFTSPEWMPFEIFIVLIPRDPSGEQENGQADVPETPPGGRSDGGSDSEHTPPPGSADWGSGPAGYDPEPPPGSSAWSVDASSDLAICMLNNGPEALDEAQTAPGEQVRYLLQVWHTGPDIPHNVVAELTIPFGVQMDWIGGSPAEMAGWPGRHFVWSIPNGSLQTADVAAGMTPGIDVWLEEFQITVDETICTTIQFDFEVSSATPDPNLMNNLGSLVESFGPCDSGHDSGEQPAPSGLPNLWVTNVRGCWDWSGDGREHVVATITGVVHNGGQVPASGVRVRITAGGARRTVVAGTIPAGGRKTVSATIDVGAYDSVRWPVPTSITADPNHTIEEGDESNNTTNSSFPESSSCR